MQITLHLILILTPNKTMLTTTKGWAWGSIGTVKLGIGTMAEGKESRSQHQFSSVQSFSHVRLFATPWTAAPGFSVHHRLPELTQTHVHWVSVAIQLSHPLSSPSPPAFNLSQHQGLFQWVSSLHQVAKGLEFQYQSFQWIFRTDLFRIDWLLVIQKRVV